VSVFPLTAMRLFMPVDPASSPGILAYPRRIGAREAHRRAMAKGDPGTAPLLIDRRPTPVLARPGGPREHRVPS